MESSNTSRNQCLEYIDSDWDISVINAFRVNRVLKNTWGVLSVLLMSKLPLLLEKLKLLCIIYIMAGSVTF